jgi:hypothetical protein
VTPNHVTGVVKTVSPTEVEQHTSSGWGVVGTFQDSIARMIPEFQDHPLGPTHCTGQTFVDSHGGCQSVPMGKLLNYREVLEIRTFFVLQKDAESVIAELRAKLDSVENLLESIERMHQRDLHKIHTEAKKSEDALRIDLEASRMETKKSRTEAQKSEDALRIEFSKSDGALRIDLKAAQQTISNLEDECDRLRQERFGVRRVDLTEDV